MVLFYTNTLKSHHFYSSYNIKDLNEIPKGGAINETLKHKIIEKKPSKFIIMIKKQQQQQQHLKRGSFMELNEKKSKNKIIKQLSNINKKHAHVFILKQHHRKKAGLCK